MDDAQILAPARDRVTRPISLWCLIAIWRWRTRFRWELEQRSRDDPRLIDDAGLTRRQIETEIAKPFWKR